MPAPIWNSPSRGRDYYPWTQDLFLGDPFAVEDGHVTVSDAPGWGVEINPGWLDGAAHAVSMAED